MPRAGASGALALALAAPLSAQAELFFEDFESGGSGWTASGEPEVLWHVAEDGECGAVTRMAVYNRSPAACDYRPGGSSSGSFLSPPFTLDGEFSIVVVYDYRQDTDEGSPCVEIVDEETGRAATVIGCTCCADPFPSAELARAMGAIPDPGAWAGRQVRLRFGFEADSARNTGSGCMVDDVRVIASGPPEVLYTEDFEGGAAGWTMASDPAVPGPTLWHVAEPGECGAVTRMGAYNRSPAACDYAAESPSAGLLRSPPLWLTGAPPFTAAFVSLKHMDARGDGASLQVSAGGRTTASGPFLDTDTLQPLAFSFDHAGFWSAWSGREVRLEFAASADRTGNLGSGWMVDDVRVTNSGSLPALPELRRALAAPPPVRGLRLVDPSSHEVHVPFAFRIDPRGRTPAPAAAVPRVIALVASELGSAPLIRKDAWTTLRVLTLSVGG